MVYAGKYESPTDLLGDESLTHGEKVEMLKQWQTDETALIRASGEGMENDYRPDVLKQVRNALISLQQSPTPPRN